jgi:hypothetical protein
MKVAYFFNNIHELCYTYSLEVISCSTNTRLNNPIQLLVSTYASWAVVMLQINICLYVTSIIHSNNCQILLYCFVDWICNKNKYMFCNFSGDIFVIKVWNISISITIII